MELSNDTFGERKYCQVSAYESETFHRRRSYGISIVKMENKTPQNVLFLLAYVDPHLIQQCLGPPQAPPETAAPTVEALAHTYAVKSPIGYNGAVQIRPQKYPFPWTDCHTPIPASSLEPSDLWCRTAAGCDLPFSTMHWTDRQTERQTDRQIVHGKV